MMNELDNQQDLYAKQLARGDLGIIAEGDGRVVGMKWIKVTSDHMIDEDEYRLLLPARSAVSLGAYVHPQWRYSGLWVALTEELMRYAHQQGVARVFCYIDGVNDQSVRTHVKYGSRILEQIVYVRVLFVRFYGKWVFAQDRRGSFAGLRVTWSPMSLVRDEFQQVALA